MATQPVCDNCGQPIEAYGWKAQPARIEHGQLVGTIQVSAQEYAERYPGFSGAAPSAANVLIGAPADLCLGCGPRAHPLAVAEAE
jgi:hypothetical protein